MVAGCPVTPLEACLVGPGSSADAFRPLARAWKNDEKQEQNARKRFFDLIDVLGIGGVRQQNPQSEAWQGVYGSQILFGTCTVTVQAIGLAIGICSGVITRNPGITGSRAHCVLRSGRRRWYTREPGISRFRLCQHSLLVLTPSTKYPTPQS